MNAVSWQPIETAPRDGTRVLLWWDGDFAPVAHWEPDGWAYHMTMNWMADRGCVIADALLGYEPTHWMPLPEPPQEDVE